jgi:hypothetical protein
MKKGTRLVIIICSVLIFLLTVLLIAGIYFFRQSDYRFTDLISIGYSNYAGNEHYVIGSGDFSQEEVKKIEVSWIAGSVTCLPSPDDQIHIYEKDTFSEKESLCWLLSDDGRLVIKFSRKIYWFSLTKVKSKALYIQIPQATDSTISELSIQTALASIQISDLEAEKKVRLDSVSGFITATQLTSESIQIDSVSGEICLSGSGQKIELDSVSGAATLEGNFQAVVADMVSANLSFTGSLQTAKIETVSGEIQILSQTIPTEFKIDTVSGFTHLFLPKDSGFTLSYDTVSGKLSHDFSVREEGEIKICGDGSCQIRVDSVSGNLQIEAIE